MQKTFRVTALSAILVAAAACDSPVASTRTAPAPRFVIGDQPSTVGGDCTETNPCDTPVLPPGGVSPNGIVVQGTSPAACVGTLPDADQDGFNDDCEYRLAAAFAPRLRFTSGDGDVSRESYWAVQYKPNAWPRSSISIAYLPAYHQDGGWAKTGITGHVGDSEFIFVNLTSMYGGDFWDAHRMYTSAHWRETWDRSETHEYSDMQFHYWAGGPPLVYVGLDKHANYNSAAKCNWNADTCGPGHFTEEIEVLPHRNVGSSHHPIRDCVLSSHPTAYPGVECFWNKAARPDFRGWTGSFTGKGSRSYRDILDYWEARVSGM